jgi:hypothetical protein
MTTNEKHFFAVAAKACEAAQQYSAALRDRLLFAVFPWVSSYAKVSLSDLALAPWPPLVF